MRFGVLGPTEVSGVPVRGAGLSGLLVLLALEAGRVVSVDRLVEALYGPSGTVNALQSQVSRLRGLVGVPLELGPAGYRLVVDPLEVDAHLFTHAVAAARRASSPGERARLLREALGLWRGPALADVLTLPFAEAEAAALEELRLSAVEDRVEADLLTGCAPLAELVSELGELVRRQPLRERLRGQLMLALARSGRRAEALEVFEEARKTLAEELGADPSPELAALHLSLLRDEPPSAVASPAASAGPLAVGRLPAASVSAEALGAASALRPRAPRPRLTSFVGRDHELRLVGRLLGRGRLLTLAGPGGAGKTRLAVEAVEAAHGLGEVCFVELAPLGPGSDVALAVLTALGLPYGHSEPPARCRPRARTLRRRCPSRVECRLSTRW